MNTTQRDLVNTLRDTSGQFGHGLDRMCVCGRRKGEHMAERPFDIDDGDHQCPGFKAAKKTKA